VRKIVFHFHDSCLIAGATRFSGRGCSCRSSGSTLGWIGTGLSGNSGGLMPRQIHKSSALFCLICSPRERRWQRCALCVPSLRGLAC
jgi:hypothetical protein